MQSVRQGRILQRRGQRKGMCMKVSGIFLHSQYILFSKGTVRYTTILSVFDYGLTKFAFVACCLGPDRATHGRGSGEGWNIDSWQECIG
jgi:hypothetical protein